MKDFFISYNKNDRIWGLGLQSWLEDAGYTTVMQSVDFGAGSNFVLEMDRATKETQRTLAVLSPDYLQADFTHPEWASAFAADPTGAERKLIPVKVRQCEVSGLLKQIVHIDLVGLDVQDAHAKFMSEIKGRNATGSAPLSRPDKRTRGAGRKVIQQVAVGNGNLQAAGHIYVNRREVHRLVQAPGPEHITEEQAFTIQQHIQKLAEIDLSSGAPSYGRWQNKLKRRFKVTSYKLIARRDYPAVLSWLRQQAAIIRPKLRRTNNARWRGEFYTGIYAKANELGMQKQQVYDLAKERLKLAKPISSLKELGEQKLERFYRIIQKL
jgi:hypothetical protein